VGTVPGIGRLKEKMSGALRRTAGALLKFLDLVGLYSTSASIRSATLRFRSHHHSSAAFSRPTTTS